MFLSHDVFNGLMLNCMCRQQSRRCIYFSTVFCHYVISAYSHVLWGLWVLLYSVLFVRHAKDQGARWRSVGWVNRPGWTSLCVSVCCCVTVGEYHDIKQYHSGLCALTQGTLCTFLQGWGDGGEAVGGATAWWLLAFWTAIAVLQLLCPWGKVVEIIMGRPLHENNGGI